MLRRLPPLKVEESDRQDFNLRDRSLPPPRAGATVLSAFPADEARRGPEQPGAQGARGAAAKGLRFRLSEGEEQKESAGASATPAPAVRLSEAETERVL
ncbi:MAG TPA: hypothetical protein VEA69_17925, partial [Tepidisphaeraceae bacterium]|nr:hypothetical protein [Tepidisphaeraceae bacterium]